MEELFMDFEPQEHHDLEEKYPYRDYYTTGGSYRPPKKPKNHGWMVAVAGAFLLCIAGGVVLGRSNGQQQDQPMETMAQETEVVTAPAVETAQSDVPDGDVSDGDVPDGDVPDGDVQLELAQGDQDILEEMSLQDIYKKLIPSVVSITATSDTSKSTGTGIVMSADGYIITNYHVISSAKSVSVLLTTGESYEAASVGGDETSDLAVLKIDAENLTPAEFGSSDTVEVGDSVVAIGDPLGTELRGTMTDGIICGINRDVLVQDRTMTLMQTNAALNSGNSGGPLVNMYGQVIGINTMKISSEYTSVEGIGFAIPISTAKPIVDELVEKGYVSGRPAFGFTVEVLSAQMKLFYNLPGCLYIRSVEEDSDAYAQGIQQGDLICAINGTEVSTMDEFNTVKNQFSAGDTVTLTIYRKGEKLNIDVRLMDRAELD
jgi:serine protease Do